MLFVAVAAASDDVAAAPARTAKVARLAALLRELSPAEAAVAVSWLSGALTQRQIGVGWTSLRGELPSPAVGATLTIEAVEDTFARIGAVAGAGSQRERRQLLDGLFAAATDREQAFLRRLLGGELRQGALLGVMADAVARAAEMPPDTELAVPIVATNSLEMEFFLERNGCTVERVECTDRYVAKPIDLALNLTPLRYLMFNAFLVAKRVQ